MVLLVLIHHSVSGILRLVNNYSYKMVMLVRFMVLISNVMVLGGEASGRRRGGGGPLGAGRRRKGESE